MLQSFGLPPGNILVFFVFVGGFSLFIASVFSLFGLIRSWVPAILFLLDRTLFFLLAL